MREFWKSFAGSALWDAVKWIAGGIAMLTAMLGWTQGFSWISALLVTLVAIVLALWASLLVRKHKAIKLGKVEFYETRNALQKAWTLIDQLNEAKDEAWVLWHSGSHAVDQQVWRLKKITRLLLPHPERASLKHLAMETGESEDTLRQAVRAATLAFLGEGVKVRWFVGLTPCTFLIGDPGRDYEWIHVEVVIRAYPNWPSFRAMKRDCPDLLHNCRKAYDTLWDNDLTARLSLDDSEKISESYPKPPGSSPRSPKSDP